VRDRTSEEDNQTPRIILAAAAAVSQQHRSLLCWMAA